MSRSGRLLTIAVKLSYMYIFSLFQTDSKNKYYVRLSSGDLFIFSVKVCSFTIFKYYNYNGSVSGRGSMVWRETCLGWLIAVKWGKHVLCLHKVGGELKY